MGNTFVIYGLRRKRAYLASEIEAEEQRQEKRREALATLDAVIRMFGPASNPEQVAAIRPRGARNLFFKRGEQMRLCIEALREAGKPILCRQVVDYCMAAKGLEGVTGPVAADRAD